jgi:hypothetical protein
MSHGGEFEECLILNGLTFNRSGRRSLQLQYYSDPTVTNAPIQAHILHVQKQTEKARKQVSITHVLKEYTLIYEFTLCLSVRYFYVPLTLFINVIIKRAIQ